jgi:hypothetical protein
VGFLWLEHALGWQHFRPEPFLILMAVTMLAIATSWIAALVRLCTRKGRWSDLLWLAASLLPAALWTVVGVTGFSNWSQRHVPRDFLMELAKRSGASLMEGEAALRYRQTATPHCRMFGDGEETSQADADRMEAYLTGLEQFTGRRLREPIHWVRGDLLGLGGLSLYGLALGSREVPRRSDANSPDAPPARLETTDRHEAGHAFMAQVLSPSADPPTTLTEGWADALGTFRIGPGPKSSEEFRFVARQWKYDPSRPPLDRLFDRSWYHQDSGVVYRYGSILVWYLVENHGVERFLDLCARIGPDRVDEVFRDVYGSSVRQIELELFRAAAAPEPGSELEEPPDLIVPSEGS